MVGGRWLVVDECKWDPFPCSQALPGNTRIIEGLLKRQRPQAEPGNEKKDNVPRQSLGTKKNFILPSSSFILPSSSFILPSSSFILLSSSFLNYHNRHASHRQQCAAGCAEADFFVIEDDDKRQDEDRHGVYNGCDNADVAIFHSEHEEGDA
jgi:hypothetical protein